MDNGVAKLAGHSGCLLEISKQGNLYVVIKTAKDKAYNPRLERQSEKQRIFAHRSFRAPRVLESGYNRQGLFAFSMEYINGFTLAEYLRQANAAAILQIAEQFVSFIPKEVAFDTNAKAAYQNKILELRPKTLTHGKEARAALSRLEKHPWSHTAPSYCHGDLTLENIIWKDGELYLIDFLDSFYDSWMQDFGKLFFDLESQWSYRGTVVDENLRTRLSIFKNILLAKLYELPHGKALVRETYHLALLHALRILPYTEDAETVKHLISSVNKLQDVIDSL